MATSPELSPSPATRPSAAIRCSRCGYPRDAGRPASACGVCGGAPRATSLARVPRGAAGQLLAGLRAPLQGLAILAATRGRLTLLGVPLLASLVTLFLAARFALTRAADWTAERVEGGLELGDASWLNGVERALNWCLDSQLASIGGWLPLLVVAAWLSWVLFPLVFELWAGPFLDVLHARVERRWFEHDPEGAFESDGAFGSEGAFGSHGGKIRRALRRGGVELSALGSSLVALILLAIAALIFLPLHLVPPIGPLLFPLAMGAVATLGIADLAFARRRFSLVERLRFVRRHALAATAFGAVCSLGFALPLLGPILVLPAASLGALWLVVKLDVD